jgi:hypothetical protein
MLASHALYCELNAFLQIMEWSARKGDQSRPQKALYLCRENWALGMLSMQQLEYQQFPVLFPKPPLGIFGIRSVAHDLCVLPWLSNLSYRSGFFAGERILLIAILDNCGKQ